jgi:hypothetical protein
LLGPYWGHVRTLGAALMKATQPQVQESTLQWPQKILALAPNLNRPLITISQSTTMKRHNIEPNSSKLERHISLP